MDALYKEAGAKRAALTRARFAAAVEPEPRAQGVEAHTSLKAELTL
jgi:hypothetical protein